MAVLHPSGAGASRPVLDLRARRVLGVLVEKAKTTPEGYPLSLNALVTGCNQKSNRDPVLSLNDDEIVDKLKEQGIDLARRTVAKYRKILNIPTARQRKEY